jgi:hypothetical protein
MSPSAPHVDPGRSNSTADLPYGPLPLRSDKPVAAEPDSPDLEANRGRPPSEEEMPPPTDTAQGEADDGSDTEDTEEPSSELDIAIARGEADDDVHFGVAAKALGVSRKTVERMVKRGALERGPSGSPATVSKRGLVAVIEERRGGGGHPARTTNLAPGQTAYGGLSAALSRDATAELQELLRPVLEPLLDDFIAARTRAAVLESQLETVAARAAQQRARDELLLTLATGSWFQRRKARRLALRHYVLRDDLEP